MVSLARRRFFSLLAAFAVVLNAWMPTFSQLVAAASTSTSDWVEICSGQGARWIQVDASGTVLAQTDTRPEGAPVAGLHGACGYCVPHAASFALPPVEPCVAARVAFRPVQLAPTWLGHAPSTQLWTTPAVRAPPLDIAQA